MSILEKIEHILQEDFKMNTGSKKVIQAFFDKKSAESKKLSTDGKTLNGDWMGGNDLAHWKEDKIEVGKNRPHVRSDQTIIRWMKKNSHVEVMDNY